MSILEVIALNARDAEAAQAGGADRLELVADMASDGLTPSVATFKETRSATDLPIRVMLRDANGFAPANLKQLRRQAWELREAGATEFVLGFLDGKRCDQVTFADVENGHTLSRSAELRDTGNRAAHDSAAGCDKGQQ